MCVVGEKVEETYYVAGKDWCSSTESSKYVCTRGEKKIEVGGVVFGYFFSNILQFQIHEALCKASGQYKEDDPASRPLFKCDIYRSKEAGVLLSHMMQYGSSVPWNEALFTATGESRLDAKALREYFRPLEEWLLAENLRTGEFVGWIYDGDYCKYSIQTANLQVSGGYYNTAPSMFSSLNYVSILFVALMTLAYSYGRSD
ncbi:hypothetical protein WDU94_006865 [Cyamophila willieti]